MLLIVGASGSGKTTIADKLSKMYGLKVLPSYTTRPKRNSQETDHTFVSKKEFDELSDKVTYLKRYDAEYCATANQIDNYDYPQIHRYFAPISTPHTGAYSRADR